MQLDDWARNGWLRTHKTSERELKSLLSIADRELRDAGVVGLSADGQFNHAYRTALTLCTMLLYASGFAPERQQSHHFRTITALEPILGSKGREYAQYLDVCRAKRNASEYDAANEATETEANELIEFTKALRALVRRQIRSLD